MAEEERSARERMVQAQLRGRDITDERVLDAMSAVPRHRFVPDDMKNGRPIGRPFYLALVPNGCSET